MARGRKREGQSVCLGLTAKNKERIKAELLKTLKTMERNKEIRSEGTSH